MNVRQKLINLAREATSDGSITVATGVHDDAEHQAAVSAG